MKMHSFPFMRARSAAPFAALFIISLLHLLLAYLPGTSSSGITGTGLFIKGMKKSNPFKYSEPVCVVENKNKNKKFTLSDKNIRNTTSELMGSLHPVVNSNSLEFAKLTEFVKEKCPDIASHFSVFNNYEIVNNSKHEYAVPSRVHIANMCLLSIVKEAFNKRKLMWMVWGGAMLGELRHGNPVPWDPDIDIIVDKKRLKEVCSAIIGKIAKNSPGLLRCTTTNSSAAFVIYFNFSDNQQGKIEVFGYDVNAKKGLFFETINGSPWWNIPVRNVFPPRNRFFGGGIFPFPRALSYDFLKRYFSHGHRYSEQSCDHLNTSSRNYSIANRVVFDCCMLTELYYFKKTFCIDRDTLLELIMVKDEVKYAVISSLLNPPIIFYKKNFSDSKFAAVTANYKWQSNEENKGIEKILCNSNVYSLPHNPYNLNIIKNKSLPRDHLLFNDSLAIDYERVDNHMISFPKNIKEAEGKVTKGLILGAIFCGEDHIMDEWLNHHIKEGVDLFILVDNCNLRKGHDKLKPYIDKGIVILFVHTEKHVQRDIYSNIVVPVARLVSSNSWLIIGDFDEFFYASAPNSTLKETLFSSFGGCRHVLIPMIKFGTNGHVKQPISVVAANTRREPIGSEYHNYLESQQLNQQNNMSSIPRNSSLRGSDNYQRLLNVTSTMFYVKTIYWADIAEYVDIHSAKNITKRSEWDKKKYRNHCSPIPGLNAVFNLKKHSNINIDISFYNQQLIKLNHYKLQSNQFYIEVKSTRGDVNSISRDNLRDEHTLLSTDQSANAVEDLTLFKKWGK